MDKINNKRKKYKSILNAVVYTSFGLLLVYHLVTREKGSKLFVERKHVVVSPASDANFEQYVDGYGVVLPDVEMVKPESHVHSPANFIRLESKPVDLPPNNHPVIIEKRNAPLESEKVVDLEVIEEESYDEIFQEKLRYAQDELEEKQEMLEDGTISEDDFEQAVSEYSQMVENFCKVSFDKGKHALANISIDLDDDIEVEFNEDFIEGLDILQGKLADLLVSASTSGFDTYADVDSEKKDVNFWLNMPDANVRMKAEVHKELLKHAEPGQIIELMIQGNPYEVEIAEVEDHAEDEVYVIDFSFTKEPDSNIKIGKTLPLKIKVKDKNQSILLKHGCYFQETGGHWVYVLSEDGSYAVKRKIRLGRKNEHVVEVIEGLNPGERVIISSYKHFKKKDKLIFK